MCAISQFVAVQRVNEVLLEPGDSRFPRRIVILGKGQRGSGKHLLSYPATLETLKAALIGSTDVQA
jgi:hypothetical protein